MSRFSGAGDNDLASSRPSRGSPPTQAVAPVKVSDLELPLRQCGLRSTNKNSSLILCGAWRGQLD